MTRNYEFTGVMNSIYTGSTTTFERSISSELWLVDAKSFICEDCPSYCDDQRFDNVPCCVVVLPGINALQAQQVLAAAAASALQTSPGKSLLSSHPVKHCNSYWSMHL